MTDRLVARARGWLATASPAERAAALYLSALLVALVAFLASLPIPSTDSDLWYHLAAGRQIATTGSIPHSADSSFLPRPWVDYSWLFQLLAWGVRATLGYGGLVALRTLLFIATAACAVALVRPLRRPRALRLSVVTLALLVLVPRFASPRPQLAGLMLLASLLLVLERADRWLAIVPVAALAWMNLHGISWPVLALVVGSYGAELLWEGWRHRRAGPPPERRRALALTAALAAILGTPSGLAIVRLPFTPRGFVAQVIDELRPLPVSAFLSLRVDSLVPQHQSFFVVLAAIALGTLAVAARAGRLRLAHLLLLIGGAGLVAQGVRFLFEGALLVLPGIAAACEGQVAVAPPQRSPLGRLAIALLALVPLLTLWQWRRPGSPFPVDDRGLPIAICDFLQRVGSGGRIFDFPDAAGYLEWRLLPRYRIFSDLQTPFPFTEEDTFLATAGFGNVALLANVVAVHHPDFLVVGSFDTRAPAVLARTPDFVPVAFDWTTVLLADRHRQPSLVAAYALRATDPFPAARGVATAHAADAVASARELRDLLAATPHNGAAAVTLGRLELAAGHAADAAGLALRALGTDAARPEPWALLADARLASGDARRALDAYLAAAARGASTEAIARKLWVCWRRLDQPRHAYRALAEAVNPLDPRTTSADLLALAETALAAGEPADAERDLAFARWLVPPGDAAARARVERALAALRPAR